MKNILTALYCLSVLFLCSCSGKPTINESETTDPVSTNFIPTAGVYDVASKNATLTLTNVEQSSFQFEISVATENALCTGEISGKATLEASTNTWRFTEADSGCALDFSFENDKINVAEAGECDHGANCSFAGMYSKTSTEHTTTVIAPLTLKNIEDYFLALPNEYLTCEIDKQYSKEDRQKCIQYKNVANGYLKADFDELKKMEFALFKDQQKGDYGLAIVYECGAGCACVKRHFLKYENGSWNDYADTVYPDLSAYEEDEASPALSLPEKGTTIKVYDYYNSNKILTTLKWNGSSFEQNSK